MTASIVWSLSWTILIFEGHCIRPVLSDVAGKLLRWSAAELRNGLCKWRSLEGPSGVEEFRRVGQVGPNNFFSFLDFKHVVEGRTDLA